MTNRFEGKVALITGANKGIGLEIARQLGVQGITVLIGARDENRDGRVWGFCRIKLNFTLDCNLGLLI